jgi:hypothetical protein
MKSILRERFLVVDLDPLINMQKTCAVSGQPFEITDEDVQFYEKMEVPFPTLCPKERQRRRIAFRNFRSLYSRKCDETGKSIVTMYREDHPFPVYDNDYWWGNEWSALDYAQDFDPTKSFFEQYDELAKKVPRCATFNLQCEKAKYSNFAWMAKNCYLVFGCVRNEDCMYGHIVWDSKDCIDNLYIFRCEWCSNCIDCVDCYDIHFSTECANCNESYFLHDCRGCINCFGCTNLRNKQFYFMNKPCSKEDYFEKLKGVQPFSTKTLNDGKEWLEKLKKEACVFPPLFGVKNENVHGNHIYESKNCYQCFDTKRCEDSKYLYTAHGENNCYDISFTAANTNFCCDCLTVGNTENVIFSHGINQSSNLAYCEFCYSSHDLFGCNGLTNAQYCIFNKQYSKEEYFVLREKIIEHMKKAHSTSSGSEQSSEWGEFFPMTLSPFAYNEAIVQEYFPLTKKEALAQGYKWKDEEKKDYKPSTAKVPDTIENLSDGICDETMACTTCGKNYQIQKQELKIHKRINIPLPSECFDCRHVKRMELRNPRKLWERPCDKCKKKIQTSFDPKRPEKVYCEKCYLNEVH